MRLSHPKITLPDSSASVLVDWICHPDNEIALEKARNRFRLVAGKEMLSLNITHISAAKSVIEDYKLPREALPTELLKYKEVWDALLVDMPLTAMIRNLGKMTNVGLLQPLNKQTQYVCQQLRDKALRKQEYTQFNYY